MNFVKKWFLIDGNRLVVAGLLVVGSFFVTYGLTEFGFITFQPESPVSTMFGSGIISGVFSLITITITVNQMILSRVFGTVDELTDRVDGSIEFRHAVENLADQPTSPNQPDQFLVLIGETISERANAFETELGDADRALKDDADEYLSDVYAYADRVENVEGIEDTLQIVSILLGPEYAQNLTATDHLLQKYDGEFSEAARTELEAILELIKAVAVTRQLFKTIVIQQNLAQLSRILGYLGVPILLSTFVVTTMYTTLPSTTVPQPVLAEVVSLGITVVLIPMSILLSYILRVASIARYTISVGPFIPPEEQI